MAGNGRVDVELYNRVKEANNCLSGMKCVMKNRALRMAAKRRLYEEAIVPTVFYGSETWSMSGRQEAPGCV